MKSQHLNSGVRVDAEDNEGNLKTYYGYINDIWELNYGISLHIPIFKCQWVKHPQVVELDEYCFTLLHLDNAGHKDDTWILPQRLAQVFYVLENEHGKSTLLSLENKESSELRMPQMKKNTTSLMRCHFLLIQKGQISSKQESSTHTFVMYLIIN
jgi:hypothetical protein